MFFTLKKTAFHVTIAEDLSKRRIFSMSKTLKATLCCLLGYSIYGFSFLFSKIGFDIAMPNMLLAVRFLIAFLVLSLFVITGKAKVSVKGKPVKKLLLMGLVQPCLYFVCEAEGIRLTTASFSGVIIGLVPVAGIILGAVFLKEKCSAFQVICTVLSVIGVALITTGGMGEFSTSGFLLLMISVIATTTFSMLSRSISGEFSAFERTYVMTGLGSICFTVIALVETKCDPQLWIEPMKSGSFWFCTLYLAIISSVGAFTLINYALNHLSIGHTLIFSNLTSCLSVVLGILVLKESFTAVQLLGIVIIILSVFGVSDYKLKTEKKEN